MNPMTLYSKLPNTADPTNIVPGNRLGISLLIQMPIAPDQRLYTEDDEPILPEISIGVMELSVVEETSRDSVNIWAPEQRKVSKKGGQEVEHVEYRA
jgi:hypothetical protein